jgi:hypothetical protein
MKERFMAIRAPEKKSDEKKRQEIDQAYREFESKMEKLSKKSVKDADEEIGIKGYTKSKRYFERRGLPG